MEKIIRDRWPFQKAYTENLKNFGGYPETQKEAYALSRNINESLGRAPYEEAKAAALRFASERGGRSGRVAYQFSRYFIGMKGLEN